MRKPPKIKFPMGQEIYNRIVWDARFDETQFEMVYQDRRGTRKTKSVVSWDPHGDIPWHRVVAITYRAEPVWDREARIERLDDLLTRPVEVDNVVLSEQWDDLPTYGYDATRKEWYPTSTQAQKSMPLEWTAVVWNVLFDLYDDAVVDSPSRWASLCATLASTQADVIVLVEMTQPFMEYLLDQPWVQQHYYSSDDIFGETLDPYGQVILSKVPMTTRVMALTAHKKVALATLQWTDTQLNVCAIHLPSQQNDTAEARRRAQLETTLSHARQLPNTMVMGDFNAREGALDDLMVHAGLLDVWQTLRPQENGDTFAPSRNTLANHTSQSKLDARYDRVLYDHDGVFEPLSIERIGARPIGPNMFASDHDGLLVRMAPKDIALEDINTTVESACTVVLPPVRDAQIQAIRQVEDRSFERWMPHINLLYPFVPAMYFGAAATALAEVLSQIEPMEITLANFETFTHVKSYTVWLAPEPAHPLIQMHAQLEEVFLQSQAERLRHGRGFCPHLSVAQFSRTMHEHMREQIQAWQQGWQPEHVVISEIALIHRSSDHPFAISHRLPLGTQGGLEGVLWALHVEHHTSRDALEILEIIQPLIEPLGWSIEDMGSTRLGTDLKDSDVDLVVISKTDASTGLTTLATTLKDALPESTQMHIAAGAQFPVLKFVLPGDRAVDLSWAQVPGDVPTVAARWHEAHLEALKSNKMLDGIWMARHLHEEMAQIGWRTTMVDAIKVIKHWAKVQGVYGTSWGYWGGVSWTIAVIWAANAYRTQHPNHRALTTHELLLETFARLASWQWPTPISCQPEQDHCDGGPRREASAHMPVLSPLSHGVNTTRAMTASTARVLKEALIQAWAICRRIERGLASWSSIMEAVVPAQAATNTLVLRGPAHVIETKMVRVILALEPMVRLRPISRALEPDVWHIELLDVEDARVYDAICARAREVFQGDVGVRCELLKVR